MASLGSRTNRSTLFGGEDDDMLERVGAGGAILYEPRAVVGHRVPPMGALVLESCATGATSPSARVWPDQQVSGYELCGRPGTSGSVRPHRLDGIPPRPTVGRVFPAPAQDGVTIGSLVRLFSRTPSSGRLFGRDRTERPCRITHSNPVIQTPRPQHPSPLSFRRTTTAA